MVPLLKFYFHEEVRKAAVSGMVMFLITFFFRIMHFSWAKEFFLIPAMPELLRSAKLAVEKGQAQGRDESYVKQLSDYIIPALVEALHKVIKFVLSNYVLVNFCVLFYF